MALSLLAEILVLSVELTKSGTGDNKVFDPCTSCRVLLDLIQFITNEGQRSLGGLLGSVGWVELGSCLLWTFSRPAFELKPLPQRVKRKRRGKRRPGGDLFTSLAFVAAGHGSATYNQSGGFPKIRDRTTAHNCLLSSPHHLSSTCDFCPMETWFFPHLFMLLYPLKVEDCGL